MNFIESPVILMKEALIPCQILLFDNNKCFVTEGYSPKKHRWQVKIIMFDGDNNQYFKTKKEALDYIKKCKEQLTVERKWK